MSPAELLRGWGLYAAWFRWNRLHNPDERWHLGLEALHVVLAEIPHGALSFYASFRMPVRPEAARLCQTNYRSSKPSVTIVTIAAIRKGRMAITWWEQARIHRACFCHRRLLSNSDLADAV
jgi:hypothetical protein